MTYTIVLMKMKKMKLLLYINYATKQIFYLIYKMINILYRILKHAFFY